MKFAKITFVIAAMILTSCKSTSRSQIKDGVTPYQGEDNTPAWTQLPAGATDIRELDLITCKTSSITGDQYELTIRKLVSEMASAEIGATDLDPTSVEHSLNMTVNGYTYANVEHRLAMKIERVAQPSDLRDGRVDFPQFHYVLQGSDFSVLLGQQKVNDQWSDSLAAITYVNGRQDQILFCDI